MKNKKGKSLIGLLLLLVAVGIFGYFGYSTMGAIKLGLDLAETELFTRITERLTDEAMSERIAKAMAVFMDTVNMTVTQQKEKVFVIPDNIEEFDFRNYV